VRFIPVWVDATGLAVAAFYNEETALLEFEGQPWAYSARVDNFNGLLKAEATTYFSDSTCGGDGGSGYVSFSFPAAAGILPAGTGLNGGYNVPVSTNSVLFDSNSFINSSGTCVENSVRTAGLPAVPVADPGIVMPMTLQFR